MANEIQNRIIEALQAGLQKKLDDCLHPEPITAPSLPVEPSVSLIHIINQESAEKSTDNYELLINNYAYKVIMKTVNNDRYIVSETFVNNATGKTLIRILMVSIRNGEMTIQYRVNPETNKLSLIEPATMQSTPDTTEAEKAEIRRQNYTRIPKKQWVEILATLNAPGYWMDVKSYRKPDANTQPECLNLFGRRTLASLYTQFPEFLKKVSGQL
jgi:hypothetical protein